LQGKHNGFGFCWLMFAFEVHDKAVACPSWLVFACQVFLAGGSMISCLSAHDSLPEEFPLESQLYWFWNLCV
jgi:hypothetical protein